MDLKQKTHVAQAGGKLYRRVDVISDQYDPQWFVYHRSGAVGQWEQLPYPGYHDDEHLQPEQLEERFQEEIL